MAGSYSFCSGSVSCEMNRKHQLFEYECKMSNIYKRRTEKKENCRSGSSHFMWIEPNQTFFERLSTKSLYFFPIGSQYNFDAYTPISFHCVLVCFLLWICIFLKIYAITSICKQHTHTHTNTPAHTFAVRFGCYSNLRLEPDTKVRKNIFYKRFPEWTPFFQSVVGIFAQIFCRLVYYELSGENMARNMAITFWIYCNTHFSPSIFILMRVHVLYSLWLSLAFR